MSLHHSRHPHRLRVIVTGGGTGGHTYPALTTITTLQARLAGTGADPQIWWVGTRAGLEARVAHRAGIPFRAVVTGRLRRSPSPREVARNIADAFRVPLGVLQAVVTVARIRPAVVLSTGGYVSVPIGLAARLFGIPYLLHEQTLALGLANRILARFATRILLSHEPSLRHLPARVRARAVVTGNPIRAGLLAGDAHRGSSAFGLAPGPPLVLVTGGAGGAQQVNRMLAAALPALLAHCRIVHQCGSLDHAEMQLIAAQLPAHLAARYRVVDFIHDELPDLLAAAEVVVGRSGAGTVAELTALGKPAVLIPYPSAAGDEQRITARHLAGAGAAIMLDGADANPVKLVEAVLGLLGNRPRRAAMAAAAASLGRPAAADDVVSELLSAATRAATRAARIPS